MIKNKMKKILVMTIIMITVLLNMNLLVQAATEITTADITYVKDCGSHLQAKDKNGWYTIVASYVEYEAPNGQKYPAYCLDNTKPGVGNPSIGDIPEGYTVSISKLLENDKVYRAAINGYPYKTPSDLGVSDKYDAYIATKQAIYSVLYDYDVESVYRGADERGDNIKKAIKSIVKKAREGTQTQTTALIEFNREGKLIEDSINPKYYSQTYKVSSNVSMKSYTITSIKDFPKNTIITDENNKKKNTFNEKERFKILIPKKEVSSGSDIKGTIYAKMQCKTYPVFYGKKSSKLQPYALTYDMYSENLASVTLQEKMNSGKVQIHKVDSQTKKPIQGVTLELQRKDGTVISSATTNKEGNAIFSNLYEGEYQLKETKTNENYMIATTPFHLEVFYDKTTYIEVENEHKKGNVVIYKVDKDNHNISLGGIEFDLFSKELNKVIGTYKTDVNGKIQIDNLRIGDYKIIEKNTNQWYDFADDVDIKVQWNDTVEKTIENELKKGQIKIIKKSKDNPEIRLKDVEFEVMDREGNILETIKTDEKGEAFTKKYVIRDFKNLILREKKTQESYIIDETQRVVELKPNEITQVVCFNEKIKGKIEITKVSADDNKLNGQKKGSPIENAVFEIYSDKDKLVDTIVTGKDGKGQSNLLEYGKYYIKEVNSGSEDYLLNTQRYEVEIKEHIKTIPITIENTSADIGLDIEKNGVDKALPNEEIKYEFNTLKNTSNVALDNFTWTDNLPYQYVRITKLYTGTYNEKLDYIVKYKTNKVKEYVELGKYDTQENHYIDFTKVELEKDEYITDFKVEFGTVKVGFEAVKKPEVFVKVLSTVKPTDRWVNKTTLTGNYKENKVKDEADWPTITYKKKLPRTGF